MGQGLGILSTKVGVKRGRGVVGRSLLKTPGANKAVLPVRAAVPTRCLSPQHPTANILAFGKPNSALLGQQEEEDPPQVQVCTAWRWGQWGSFPTTLPRQALLGPHRSQWEVKRGTAHQLLLLFGDLEPRTVSQLRLHWTPPDRSASKP